jgi:hypothetical protein
VATWNILWQLGIFCGNLVYLVVPWYILWYLGIFCGKMVYFVVTWYVWTEKNLANLLNTHFIKANIVVQMAIASALATENPSSSHL